MQWAKSRPVVISDHLPMAVHDLYTLTCHVLGYSYLLEAEVYYYRCCVSHLCLFSSPYSPRPLHRIARSHKLYRKPSHQRDCPASAMAPTVWHPQRPPSSAQSATKSSDASLWSVLCVTSPRQSTTAPLCRSCYDDCVLLHIAPIRLVRPVPLHSKSCNLRWADSAA